MKTPYVPGDKTEDAPRRGRIPFMSPCPKCTQVRLQRGYNRKCLLRLLDQGYPVEAYCETCDEFWSISAKERAALVAATIAGDGAIIC
jgi:hypothetical protein